MNAVRNPPSGTVRGYIREPLDRDGEPFGDRLVAAGASSVSSGTRLDRVLATLSDGDALMVPSLDHLGISMWRAFDFLSDMARRSIVFMSLDEGIDTSQPHMVAALDVMRAMLDAEKRLMARRSAESSVRHEQPPPDDRSLERSREAVAPWIDLVRELRPAVAWDRLFDRIAASGQDVSGLSARRMRRHVRRLVEAGDLPASVLDRASPRRAGSSAECRARHLAETDPGISLREIGARLDAEGVRPPRAPSWSAQTVKRLLKPKADAA